MGVGGGSALHVHSFCRWVSKLPKIIHKLVETNDGPIFIMLGFVSTIFIDDTLLMGDSEKECVQNVKSWLALFKSPGFAVHTTKSVLTPSHKTIYLGFEIDSQSMTVVPNLERKQRILSTASKLLTGSSSTVRELGQLIGQDVSCFQGVKFDPIWYRYMENDKIRILKQSKGDYESIEVFSNEAKSEMIWWTENIMSSFSDVHSDHSEPDFVHRRLFDRLGLFL